MYNISFAIQLRELEKLTWARKSFKENLMGHRIFVKSVVAVLLMVLVCGCFEQQAHKTECKQSSVQTVAFDAPSVGRSMRFNLVLPGDYETSNKRYPVLYLLHGYGGYYMGWIDDGADDHASAYDLIVVVPDSGNSWYANWAVSTDEKKNNWEDYIIKDIVGYVDSHYRTIARREGRAIGGLSMGGYGATVLGLRNADMFCSIATHSGVLSHGRKYAERIKNNEPVSPFGPRPNWMSDFDVPGFGTYSERSPRGQIVTTVEQAEAIDPFKLVTGLDESKRPDIYMVCGRSDFLFEANKEFARHLRENNITHTSRVSDGAHNHDYWAREIRYSMAHQYQVIQKALKSGADK
jgi:putative tributyrin esterase